MVRMACAATACVLALPFLNSSGRADASSPEARRSPSTSYVRPVALPNDWPVAHPHAVQMDTMPLVRMAAMIRAGAYPNVHSVLVIRNGKLVFEEYFDGPDARFDGKATPSTFGRDTLHDMRSISKSVTALLLGIAIDRGAVPGVNVPVLGYYPENADLRDTHRNTITIKHLLTMTSGLAGDEEEPEFKVSPDQHDALRTILTRRLVAEPGTQFIYAGGNTTLIRGIVERATKQPFERFAHERLFAPLGIQKYEWMRWLDGTPLAAGGLRLRPRDMAKIGYLMLNDGRWEGRRIVSRSWIEASGQPLTVNDEGERYGYHWWVQDHLFQGRRHRATVAMGSGGQRILAFKDLNLIVVFTGGNYEDMAAAKLPEVLVPIHVLRALEFKERPLIRVNDESTSQVIHRDAPTDPGLPVRRP